MSNNLSAIQYRNDINLLRALAIIFVVIFHLKARRLTGGFIGVDIFFVISGYLMTSIIFAGMTKGSFSLKRFYSARLRRIVPALSVMVLAFTAFFYFFLFDSELNKYLKSAPYALTFLSNLYFYKESVDYFSGADVSYLHLLHTWSLATEFQFYILYPLILLFLKRFIRQNKIKYIVLCLFIASLVSSIIISQSNSSLAYYMLPTRAWQLLAGALVFLFPINIKNSSLQSAMQYIAFAGLIASAIFITEALDWPGIYSAIPIALTVLFLYANKQDSYLAKNRVFSYLGAISYSLYLYHWPVILVNKAMAYSLTLIYMLLLIGFCIILAHISYKYIERKFNIKYTIILVILSTAFFAISKDKISNHNDIDPNINRDLEVTKEYTKEKLYSVENSKEHLFVIGDSFAGKLKIILSNINKESLHMRYTFNSQIGCFYFLDFMSYTNQHKEKCDIYRNEFLSLLDRPNLSSEILILALRWEIRTKPAQNYHYRINGEEKDLASLSEKEFASVIYNTMDNTLKALDDKGAKVILMLQPPVQKDINIHILYRKLLKSNLTSQEIDQKLLEESVDLESYRKKYKGMNDKFRALANKYKNVYIFDPAPFLCTNNGKCPIGNSHEAFYVDYSHISRYSGAFKIQEPLKNLILDIKK